MDVAEYWVCGEAFYDEVDGDSFVLVDVRVLSESHACSEVAGYLRYVSVSSDAFSFSTQCFSLENDVICC